MNNRFRNLPCPCKSGMKFKYCCLPKHEVQAAGLVTQLAQKIYEKTATYWRKRYKKVSTKSLNEPMMGTVKIWKPGSE